MSEESKNELSLPKNPTATWIAPGFTQSLDTCSPEALVIYMRMRFRRSKAGRFDASLRQLSKLLPYGRNTISSALQELEGLGLIIKTRVGRRGTSSEWRMPRGPQSETRFGSQPEPQSKKDTALTESRNAASCGSQPEPQPGSDSALSQSHKLFCGSQPEPQTPTYGSQPEPPYSSTAVFKARSSDDKSSRGKKNGKPQEPKAVRERDPIWDVLHELFYPASPEVPRNQRSKVGATARDLKAMDATPEQVRSRHAEASRQWSRAFGPEALVKHWTALAESARTPQEQRRKEQSDREFEAKQTRTPSL